MTTEIAILNRSAVALAADSAVSVSGPGGLKVYDGVNKLFELVRGRPVGVMIYNAAELSFRPWETIIKTYRDERRSASFPTLDAYVTTSNGLCVSTRNCSRRGSRLSHSPRPSRGTCSRFVLGSCRTCDLTLRAAGP